MNRSTTLRASHEQPLSDPIVYRLAKRMEALLDLKNDMGQTLRMRHYEEVKRSIILCIQIGSKSIGMMAQSLILS